jgi:hypothetical protein
MHVDVETLSLLHAAAAELDRALPGLKWSVAADEPDEGHFTFTATVLTEPGTKAVTRVIYTPELTETPWAVGGYPHKSHYRAANAMKLIVTHYPATLATVLMLGHGVSPACTLHTHQHYENRIIQRVVNIAGLSDDEPRMSAGDAATAFVALASTQCPNSCGIVSTSPERAEISLSRWPEVPFGPWFDHWARAFGVVSGF